MSYLIRNHSDYRENHYENLLNDLSVKFHYEWEPMHSTRWEVEIIPPSNIGSNFSANPLPIQLAELSAKPFNIDLKPVKPMKL